MLTRVDRGYVTVRDMKIVMKPTPGPGFSMLSQLRLPRSPRLN